ncbi:TadE/TadG family type IV pilus assembly protein [Nonomuraea sp. NPDC050556]|uniref:TadE/TadG family type IV pilus assembly protein n=1 Tax=Nonomuraea sp. NPDC050556 TaxID=3364369 RepID=UPI0037903577
MKNDRGSLALELAIVSPALIAMLIFAIAVGRVAIATGSIEAAARDAARQASIARDPSTARSAALSSAQEALAQEGLNCSPSVTVDTHEFAKPVGVPAIVTATVECEVLLSDLSLPGIPGSKRLSSTFSSPLDPFRARSR